MLITKSRPNPNKRNPSLAHLRACVIDCLEVPETPPGRYEKELRSYIMETQTPYLKQTPDKKPERIGNVRI